MKMLQGKMAGDRTLLRYKALHDAATANLAFSAMRCLGEMISLARGCLEEGIEADEAYKEFDMGRLAGILALDTRTAAEVLARYSGEDLLMASVFIASAIMAVDGTDAVASRRIIGNLISAAEKDASLGPAVNFVLLTISDVGSSVPEDQALSCLAACCARRL
jgi:hypothetical protein